MASPKPLRIGVMLEEVQLSDIVGIDIFGNLSKDYVDLFGAHSPPHAEFIPLATPMEFFYMATTMEPGGMTPNLRFVPNVTYDTCPRDLDIVITGGPMISHRPAAADRFMKEAWASVRVWMTTCVGSMWLASSGMIEGKKATTNRGFLTMAKKLHPGVEWVDQRWVVQEKEYDGKRGGGKGELWTAGGAGAGIDMIATYALQNFNQKLVQVCALDPLEFHPKQSHTQFYNDSAYPFPQFGEQA